MRIFKFGGASVKDTDGVRNLVDVLQTVGHDNTLLIISAMGKMTNAFEVLVGNYFDNKSQIGDSLTFIVDYHTDIIRGLFPNPSHPIYTRVSSLYKEIESILKTNKSPDYNFVYDQVVCYGEFLSTSIISAYLNEKDLKNDWLDVRDLIKTDNYYRRAKVNWDLTQRTITENVNTNKLNITQGFLGSDANNFTTTLGREGSDYTAAIFAYCLNADSVTIWKDVPGVLNADPRYFQKTQLLNQISYREAIELAFYGASVIHPKTLQPLQRKEIPLYVKSFIYPQDNGTCVSKGTDLDPKVPCFIVKKNQVLLSLSTLDFSFIVEENISEIFNLLHLYKMKVDVIQNSAISFSVCVDNNFDNLDKLLHHLKAKFKVSCNPDVSLYTIRHYNDSAIKSIEKGKNVLLKQLYQQTVQIVTE